MAQIVFNDNEVYSIGQSYGDNPISTQHIQLPPGMETPQLTVFGISPQDLTMSFMYGKLLGEDESDSFRGQKCRVFRLQNTTGDGWNRVYISTEYIFPLKVQFFNNAIVEKKPFRTLEISGFRKEKDFWMVSELSIYGPDWKTRIEFDETDAGYRDESTPKNLFER